ncbi:TrmH family RNA methyltransferase [Maledivibacter halophilus]|uniref:RNA methyltransferase, TrmH family n=1 Tax=Maledivibacter halophilus TaxID=36842 RepID=A0A1T5LVS8_9FIRM|nr:TrmH family RNA methyltransferase [Maledivibacter halophilus]SKC79944.1 RNA methyltransferase, TrmH family [Maledivibacter halophilus]
MVKKKVIRVIKEDNNFQHFEVIKRNRNKRYKHRKFFVEGVRNIKEAIRNGWDISSFLYSREKRLSDWAREILDNVNTDTLYELSQNLMDKLSGKEDTSELLAIVKMKEDSFSRIKLDKNPLIVVIDRPSNRGNLGTLIRSCDSLNCNGLIMTGHAVDLFDPKTIISSVGTIFSLPTLRLSSYKEVYNWIQDLKEHYLDLQVVGTSASGDKAINQCDFSKPTILLLGNETVGLNRNYKDICDVMTEIPIDGVASSLNVSCAASIMLYEIKRQRYL